MVAFILFWIAAMALFSGLMCWKAEQEFQTTSTLEEEQYYSAFRNMWFLCEQVAIVFALSVALIVTICS